jgi:hypothetical protein
LLHETKPPKHAPKSGAKKCSVNLFLQRSFCRYGKSRTEPRFDHMVASLNKVRLHNPYQITTASKTG